MSEFIAQIRAELDTSEAEKKLKSFTDGKEHEVKVKTSVDEKASQKGFDETVRKAQKQTKKNPLEVEVNYKEGRRSISQLADSANRLFSMFSGTDAMNFGADKIRDAIGELKEMDSILTEISKTSDSTASELKALGNESFSVASEYGRKAADYLTAVQEMARSGFYGQQGEAMAELSMLGQAAGDMSSDVSNSYLLATNAAYDYAGSVEKLGTVLDGQNLITNRNSVAMIDMAQATSKAASMAAQTGVEVDELSSIIGTAVARTKQNGNVIGTALKSLFVNLQDTSNEKIVGTFKELGISQEKLVNGSKQLKTPIELLKELSAAYASLPEGSTLKADVLRNIGQKRQANVLSAILGGISTGDYDKMLTDYAEGKGSAMEEAAKSADNLEGRLNKLKNTWVAFISDFAQTDTMKGGISFLDNTISAFDKLQDAQLFIPTMLSSIMGLQNLFTGKGITDIGYDKDGNGSLGKLNVKGNLFGIDFTAMGNWKNHFKEAETAIEDWNIQCLKGRTSVKEFDNAFKKDNKDFKKYISTVKDGSASLEGYQEHLKSTGVVFKQFGNLKSVLANVATGFLAAGAIELAIAGITTFIDQVIHKQDRLKETVEESKSAYSSTVSELQSINSELETTQARIKELKSKGKLLPDEKVELARLEETNSKLETQLGIKESIANTEMETAAKAARKSIDFKSEKVMKRDKDGNYALNDDGSAAFEMVDRKEYVRQQIAEMEKAQAQIDEAQKKLANKKLSDKDRKAYTRQFETATGMLENYKKEVADTIADLNEEAKSFYDEQTGIVIKDYEKDVKEMNQLNDEVNNFGLTGLEKAFNNLNSYFDGSASKNALKKKLVEAAKAGTSLEKVLNRVGLTASDLGANVDENTLKQYFDDIKSSAQEAGEVAKNYKASVSDVEEAVASENQDKDWSTIQSSYEAAKKLLKEGKTGTDDFQTMASFLNPKKVKEYAEQGGKYTADAYQKAFQEIQATADRWFGEDETKSMENFVNDFKGKGLWDVTTDEKGLWDISTNFKTTTEAADQFGVSIEAVETMLHGLEAYGYDFSNIMFSGESLSEYESSLNEIKAIYDKMGEGPARERLGTLIEGFDKEFAGFEEDMSSLTEDKIVHIQFEYDLASIQAEIDAIDQKEKTGGEIGRTDRSDRIGYRDAKYEDQKEGLGLNNKDVEIPVQFTGIDEAVSKAKDELEKAAKSGDEAQIEAGQLKVENAQKIRDELANSFDEWNQQQEVPITFKSNADEINNALKKFSSQPTTIEVDARLNKEEVETAMSSMSGESVITFTADYGDFETQVAAIKDQEGNITYFANIDGEPTEVELNKDGTIHYDADMSKANAKKAPEKESWVNYAAKFLAAAPPILTGVVRYSAVFSSVANAGANIAAKVLSNAGLGGGSGADGTAHAEGTAKASGDWSVKKNETALTGEVGQEVVVRKGKFFTVGDNGAEMVDLQKGDIVFNHKQTEELFKHGYVTSNGGRGKVVGEAHAEGTAYRLGSGKPAGGSRPKTKPVASSNNNSTPSSDNSSSDSAKDFKETIDYIEMAIDRIERQIKNVERIAGSAYNTFAKRNNALKDQLSSINEELDIQQAGYDRYIQEADSVSLSEDYKNQVRNGTIDISTITDESLAENIKDFQQWYEKALDCRDAVEELKESVRDLYKEAFDNVITLYDGMLGQIEHRQKILEGFIDQTETQGYIVSTRYYDALISNEQGKLEKLIKQRQDSIAAMNDAIINGNIEVNSEQWYEFQEEINKVNEEIQDAETSLIKFNNSIRELKWDVFDKIQDRISGITDEADFLIDLMSSQDMYDDEGNVTKQGTATYGLHGVNYNVYMSQADQYKKEMESIQEELSKDPHNETLIERRKELLELQQESILAAEEEKEAIKSLVEDGIEKELDALDKLIDKYLDAIDSEKDLRDYQKKVESQQSEVSSLRKQLVAYAGDNSEEGSAKRQKLQNDLKEAEENLEETQYEKAISDQKKLLDELYSEYETVLNMRLDNIDQLIASVIENVNLQADEIRETLATETGKVGYQLTDSMNTIWGTNGTFANILTTYGNNFTSILTSVQTAINDIKLLIQNAVTQSDASAESNITATNEQQAEQTTVPAEPPTPEPPAPESHNGGDGVPRIGDAVTFASGRYYYDSEGANPSGNQMLGQQVYITSINNASWARKQYHISKGSRLGAEDLGWVSLDQLEGYKTGKDYINKDQLAWTQEDGPELVVSRSDGAILTPLKQGDAVINNSETEKLLRLANDPTDYFHQNLKRLMPGISTVVNDNSSVQNNINVNIEIDKVTDYNSLVTQLQKDKKVERLIQAVTIDRLAGKNSLAKYNIRMG